MEQELHDIQSYMVLDGYTIGGGAVRVIRTGTDSLYWRWAWSTHRTLMDDIDVQGNRVWYIAKSKEDAYDNHLRCEDASGHVYWSKPDMSSQVAVIAPYCYYVRTMNYFTAIEVCVCDADTGNNERVLYREKNPEKDLVLYKTTQRTLYFKSEDANGSDLYEIDGERIRRLYPHSAFQMPLGKGLRGTHGVLTRTSIAAPWVAQGAAVDKWHFPPEEVEWVNLLLGLVLTIKEGAQTLWHCADHRRPVRLYHIKAGTMDMDPWSQWEQSIQQCCMVKTPFRTPYLLMVQNQRVLPIENLHSITKPLSLPPLEFHRFHATSMDGTWVPYIMVKVRGMKPIAQLVYVYGAYGETTPVMWPYQTWYPLLTRGWVIVYAMVRGGGDNNAAWANAARRDHRHRAIDDYEVVIRAAQHRLRMGPSQTVLYGRSAGGVPVGAMVSRYPDGTLMGAVFTEVPYVDVLRTTTNPSLPLTKGEFKEFGDPLRKILDMKELLSVSPVHTLPPEGAPGVFVLTHVGRLDRQVYAYESFKWIQLLRGATSEEERDPSHPHGKYLAFETKEAHQYRPEHLPHLRGVDMAILHAWVEGTLRLDTPLRKK